MVWLIVAIVAYLLFELWVWRTPELGRWSFTRRPDGKFSRWQIAGQVLVVGFPGLLALCLFACMFANWIAEAIHGTWHD